MSTSRSAGAKTYRHQQRLASTLTGKSMAEMVDAHISADNTSKNHLLSVCSTSATKATFYELGTVISWAGYTSNPSAPMVESLPMCFHHTSNGTERSWHALIHHALVELAGWPYVLLATEQTKLSRQSVRQFRIQRPNIGASAQLVESQLTDSYRRVRSLEGSFADVGT